MAKRGDDSGKEKRRTESESSERKRKDFTGYYRHFHKEEYDE